MPGPLTNASPRQRKIYRRSGGDLRAVRRDTGRTRAVNTQIQNLSSQTGAAPHYATSPKAGRKEVSRQNTVAAALARVRRGYRSAKPTAPFDPDEIATLARSRGASKDEARALSTKVIGESGGDPKAIGHDPGGSTGLGLLQVTKGVGNDDLIARHGGVQAMLKPGPNIDAALEILRDQGLGAWYAPSNAPGNPRRRGPAKKDLKTLRRAGVSPPRPTKGAKAPKKGKRSPASVAELFYDPGTSIKNGQPTASIGGHSDHVHVASEDPRAEKKFINIARNRFGLHVGENEFVGDPPEAGIHTEHSYHYREGTLPSGRKINLAADVSGEPQTMAAYDEFIAKKFGGNPQAGSGGTFLGGGAGSVNGITSSGLSAYADATGMSVKSAKAVAKKNPNLVKNKLARIRKAYASTTNSSSGGLTRSSRARGAPVV